MRKPLLPTLVLLASAGLLTLTGCAGGADNAADDTASSSSSSSAPSASSEPAEETSGEQTVEEACSVAITAMNDVQSETSEAFAGMSSGDLGATGEALAAVQQQLVVAADGVTNAEVKDVLDSFSASFAVITEQLELAQTAPESIDQAALQTASTDLQTAGQELQTLCS